MEEANRNRHQWDSYSRMVEVYNQDCDWLIFVNNPESMLEFWVIILDFKPVWKVEESEEETKYDRSEEIKSKYGASDHRPCNDPENE